MYRGAHSCEAAVHGMSTESLSRHDQNRGRYSLKLGVRHCGRLRAQQLCQLTACSVFWRLLPQPTLQYELASYFSSRTGNCYRSRLHSYLPERVYKTAASACAGSDRHT